jgi:chorismate-pyruvate lyase
MTLNRDNLSLFQKVLLATDGTVTDLIALTTGQAIRVKKLEQTVRTDTAPPELRCSESTRLLQRRILLAGPTQNYLYADSLFVFERLSAATQQQLLNTEKPIGLLWKDERLETFREIVDQRIEICPLLAPHFDLPASVEFVSRKYLIHHKGKPLGAITEKWPMSLFRE